MSNFFQPLRDVFADAGVPGAYDALPVDDEATHTATSATFPLGEVGGVIFTGDQAGDAASRFQQVGGALYSPFLPFGTIAAAQEIDAVALRTARRHAAKRSDGVIIDVVRSVLSYTVFPLCPILRSVCPRQLLDIAGEPSLVDERKRDAQRNRDMVVAMAFHHHLPLLAVATRDASYAHRVQIYDVAQESRMPVVLAHALQNRAVHTLAWKPFSRDALVVGCDGGVLCWSLTAGALANPRRAAGGVVDGGAPYEVHPYGPLWGSITDETPMAVWLACSPAAPVSSIAFTSDGRYIACGSEHSVSVHLHDVSVKPRDSLVVESIAVEGGTCALCFSPADDGFLVRAIRNQRCIKLMSTSTFRTETITTEAPVCGIVALPTHKPSSTSSSPPSSSNVFVLQYANTEGVALATFHMDHGPQHRGGAMVILGLISTGVYRGVGGAVAQIAVDGKRLYLRVKSGHVVVVSIQCSADQPWSVRGVGCVPPSASASPAAFFMATSPSFHKGSLLAMTFGNEVRLLPSYYRK